MRQVTTNNESARQMMRTAMKRAIEEREMATVTRVAGEHPASRVKKRVRAARATATATVTWVAGGKEGEGDGGKGKGNGDDGEQWQ
jgi:hypothetical protein